MHKFKLYLNPNYYNALNASKWGFEFQMNKSCPKKSYKLINELRILLFLDVAIEIFYHIQKLDHETMSGLLKCGIQKIDLTFTTFKPRQTPLLRE